MIRTVSIILILCIGSTFGAADESREPPLKYTLVINGREHDLVLDKSVRLQGDYSNPTVALKTSSIRHFSYGDITFHYPASFGWEAEIEGTSKRTWTLSGNDFKIMYFILPDVLSVEAYSQAMAAQLGKRSVRISDTELELGGHRLKGKLLFVKLAGTTLNIEVYSFPAKTGSRLFVLQDSPPDNNARSKEGERALAMLSSSFKYAAASKKTDAGDGK